PTRPGPGPGPPRRPPAGRWGRCPPPSPPSPEPRVNRCCTTRLQVVPQASSPHRAASAIRRSPGGSTPYSRRSLPLDPPSSATVTMAVRSLVTRRSADNDAYRPWPPPSATTRRLAGRPVRPAACLPPGSSGLLTSEVAVCHLDRGKRAGEPGGDLVGDHHAAVLSAGAADSERDEVLAAALEARQRDVQGTHICAEELLGSLLPHHVLLD